ncbi:NAD(P)/FAD-dependent oxidoreductase [Jatrophihabitans sp.]|uniref:flavin-containing monooxygenase n=1 Tax=Jatrophihabitans sp. TaxID=1932789 RepID=UPI0030C6E8CC
MIVVGAGFGGIAAAIELAKHGFDDVILLEAADELGGTWHYNTYPGAACDVPSHFYSYSFAQRRDWTRLCSRQPEILDYIRTVAKDFDVASKVVTATLVTNCRWDDATCTWTVTADGPGGEVSYVGEAIVLATGQLNQPMWPRIEGIDDFAGHSFHSARWDHDYDLRGKRVAVVGTGASAVQFIPAIAPEVEELVVFQRSGNWFLPRRNRAYPKPLAALYRSSRWLQAYRRGFLFRYGELLTAGIRNPKTVGRVLGLYSTLFMRRQLRDPEVRKKAWPDYTFGCKRVLFSSAYLPALQRENVELVTEPILRMTTAGPETASGVQAVDCVIYGSGFKTNDFMFPMEITGVGGLSLREAWADGPHAHLGITVPGFPSMFILYGPNTNTSGGSIIYYLEAQAGYLRQALQHARDADAAAIEVLFAVEAASDRAVQAAFAGTAWTQCDSWYRNEAGRTIANWPGYMRQYGRQTEFLDPSHFQLIERPGTTATRAG